MPRCAVRRVPAVPVVLRAEGVGRGGDCLWQLDAPCGRRIKRQCMDAAGFVAPDPRRPARTGGRRISPVENRLSPLRRGRRAAAHAPAAGRRPRDVGRNPSGPPAARTGVPGRGHDPAAGGPVAGPPAGGVAIACRAVARARLWLVGPAENRAAVQQQIDRLQLTGRVVLAGVFDQVEELLAAADLLLAPSPDGAPVALLEAMAAGLPSVAADTTANRSVLADGQEGLLLAADDADALAAGVTRLYHEPELAARMGHAARAGRNRVLSCQDGRPARNMVSAIMRRARILHIIPSLDRAAPKSK